MISPGALVVCSNFGDTAFVVRAKGPDNRWHLRGKRVDTRGRAFFFGRIAGEGDLQVVKPAPVYAVGSTIKHEGLSYIVARDLGDHVELTVPGTRRPLQGGGHLHIAAGNTVTIDKADLTLEELK